MDLASCFSFTLSFPLPETEDEAPAAEPLRTLVIDTATAACSIALIEGGQVIAAEHREAL